MYYVDDIPIRHLREIGAISVNTARLEFAMSYCITILNCSEFRQSDTSATLCLIGGESFDILLSKLKKLFYLKVKDSKLREQFADVAQRLGTVNEDRNRYIHAHLVVEKRGKIARIRYRKRMDAKDSLADIGSVSLVDLRSLAERAFIVGNDLFSVIMENLDTIHAGYKNTTAGLVMGRQKIRRT